MAVFAAIIRFATAADDDETGRQVPRDHFSIMKTLLLLAVLTITACAKPQFVSGHPTDPNLPQKLGLSQQEWNEIQSEFQRGDITRETKPFFWARSRSTGAVEVHCIAVNSQSPEASGPVFLFDIRDGHWRLLREMSEWKK